MGCLQKIVLLSENDHKWIIKELSSENKTEWINYSEGNHVILTVKVW